jgi:hypothetical protein
MIASSTYGFDLPKEHSTWSFGTATSTSATGTVLLNMQTGPGLLLMQKYLVQESVDTTGMGTVAAAQSRADSSTNWWNLKIIVDGETRLDGIISHVTGFGEACPAGVTDLFSKPVHQRARVGANCYSTANFCMEFPIAYRDSIRIVCTAYGSETYQRPYLYYNIEGWHTEDYIEDYNYYCYGDIDTMGWFDYAYLGGLTTDTTGTGLAGGFTRFADTWTIPGTFDSAVTVDATGAGAASGSYFLETEIVLYNAGDVIRTTLAAAADSSDTSFKVNYTLTGIKAPAQRSLLILDADEPQNNRNFGGIYFTYTAADSTITTYTAADTLASDFAQGDSVFLFMTPSTAANGDMSVFYGIEEWLRYCGYYDMGESHSHYSATKNFRDGGDNAVNLGQDTAEPFSAVMIYKPAISAYSYSTEKTNRMYWVQSSYTDEGSQYYTILSHYMHCYVQGAGGLIQ